MIDQQILRTCAGVAAQEEIPGKGKFLLGKWATLSKESAS
jgi:hypothetical protein